MTELLNLTAGESEEGLRLDAWLSQAMPDQSRSYIQKLIRSGQVLVNGSPAKTGLRIRTGDRAEVQLPEPEATEVLPEDIPLDILYEDEHLLVVNKPKGMVVHPAAGHISGTLVNALLYHCKDSLSGINGVLRPGIVHRIDKDTTGTLVVCKTDLAHRSLAEQLKEHSITRRYRAITHGVFHGENSDFHIQPGDRALLTSRWESGTAASGYGFSADGAVREATPFNSDGKGMPRFTVEGNIGRHAVDRKKMTITDPAHGKPAVTHVTVLQCAGQYSYVECELETGRTHQIRVHLSHLGHPILGDPIYGPAKCPVSGLQGQTLHAMVLGFRHPVTGAYMEFRGELPAYFLELLKKLDFSV